MCGRGGRESEGGSAPNCHWDTDLEPAIRQHQSGTRCVWIERNDEALVQISKASEAAKVSSSAVGVAQKTIGPASSPSDSSAEFGEVIKVIASIRSANELAGLERNDRGSPREKRGKAVVANEVKELAKETAKATEDISRKIESIQLDTKDSVEVIGTISGIINQISDISATVASGVEEQNATTNEMSRNVTEAA